MPWQNGRVCGNDAVVLACQPAADQPPIAVCAATSAGTLDLYAPGHPHAQLLRSHLMFAGNTGGYAFTVVDGPERTVLYAVDGTGVQDHGVIVTDAQGRTIQHAACTPGSFEESQDDAVIDASLRLPNDPTLDRGLPAH